MTPTTAADKVKEICIAYLEYWRESPMRSPSQSFDKWVSTFEGSRLVGELGEDWKEDDVLLLRELAMRSDLMFPENDQDLKWCNEGIANQPDFFIRLYERLGVKDKIN